LPEGPIAARKTVGPFCRSNLTDGKGAQDEHVIIVLPQLSLAVRLKRMAEVVAKDDNVTVLLVIQ